MHIFRFSLIVLLFSSSVAMAAPAKDSSIKQLLNVMHARSLLDGVRRRTSMAMDNSMKHALHGKKPNAKQEAAIRHMKHRIVVLLEKNLSWHKLEPMYLRLYKETFSEEEISGMLAFYKTPAGQAVIHKLPLLTQNIMLEMQKTLNGMMPQMQQIQRDFIAQMQAADK